jgi:hypothetical protein
MNQLREHPWLFLTVMIVVFLAALSMHMERTVGWGLLILCFAVGSLSGLGLIWVRNQLTPRWRVLSKLQKRVAIASALILVVVQTFVSNRHKANEFANDAAVCFGLVVGLSLWGLARLTKSVVDTLRARFSKR